MNEWMYACLLTEDNDWLELSGRINEWTWMIAPPYTENNDWDEYKDQMNERMIASLQNND